MNKVIKEGMLRVLISESTCDVILSCRDHRLRAHKLILSIASPVFRELLQKNTTDSTTVIILPDIKGSMMSTVLDYIYTGTAVVYSNSLQEFLSLAKFLQIAVDSRNTEGVLETLQKVEDVKKLEIECNQKSYAKELPLSTKEGLALEKMEICKSDVKKQDVECQNATTQSQDDSKTEKSPKHLSELKLFHHKAQKRLPELLPISRAALRKNTQKKMSNVVVPSPWSRRNDISFLGDPREVSIRTSEKEVQKTLLEDTNNNFQPFQKTEPPKGAKSLDTIIRHLYLNNLDSNKDRILPSKVTRNSAILGEDYSRRNNFLDTEIDRTDCEDHRRDISKLLKISDTAVSFMPSHSVFKHFESGGNVGRTSPNIVDKIPCETSTTKCQNDTSHTFNSLPLDFAHNLSLRRKETSLPQSSPNNIPPTNTTSKESPTILNIPTVSSKESRRKSKINSNVSAQSVDVECGSNSNSNSNFNDVSNDNSMSNDSNDDEKREDEVSSKKKSYECAECGKCFSQLRNYKYHRSVHEGTKEFSAKCPECGKMFNDRGYLSSHMKIHRDRKEYACPHCPKRFNQRVAYNMHLRIHTGVKPHECPTCGKSFSRKMLLKQHQRVHTGERPYTCPECGKTFADRSNMSLHARLHTGVKPYACTLCPKSFTKKHHLKTHMNFHTGLKPYSCENCSLAFSQSSNMRTHYKKCILKDNFGKGTKTESISSAENNSS